MHHILVESGHYDHDKDSAKELFEEVLAGNPVVEYENPAMFAVADGLYDAVKACIQLLYRAVDNEKQGCDQAERLQGICPYNRFDSTFVGVYPYEGYGADSNHPERNMHLLKHMSVQDQTDEIQFGCCSQHTGEQEEERTGAVSVYADTCAEISVDACQV